MTPKADFLWSMNERMNEETDQEFELNLSPTDLRIGIETEVATDGCDVNSSNANSPKPNLSKFKIVKDKSSSKIK